VRTARCRPRQRQETTIPLIPASEPGAWGEALAGRNEPGVGDVGPRGARVGRVGHRRLPWNQAEIRRPIDGSPPCPARCHEGRWLPRPFSRAAALDSSPSCSGGFLQGLDERRLITSRLGSEPHDPVLPDDRHPVRVIGQGDHDPLDDQAARGGTGERSDWTHSLPYGGWCCDPAPGNAGNRRGRGGKVLTERLFRQETHPMNIKASAAG
jgi:hypothetical protein